MTSQSVDDEMNINEVSVARSRSVGGALAPVVHEQRTSIHKSHSLAATSNVGLLADARAIQVQQLRRIVHVRRFSFTIFIHCFQQEQRTVVMLGNEEYGSLKPGFHSNAIACVACVNENRKKRKRLRWQAASRGCHCFDRAFLLAGACVCCLKFLPTQHKRLRLNRNRA